jgi:chromate transport protein ChrA
MFSMALAIRNVQNDLPNIVYAMLSGLNSAIIGVIALAGQQLAARAILNKMHLALVVLSGAIAMLYRGKPWLSK